jgi:uncharacterized protein (UPF0335 family)
MTQITAYAKELANHLREISKVQENVKDLIASAKDAGINVRALRKVAREILMEPDKLEQLYDDEQQLSLFRSEVGLTQRYAEAAE